MRERYWPRVKKKIKEFFLVAQGADSPYLDYLRVEILKIFQEPYSWLVVFGIFAQAV